MFKLTDSFLENYIGKQPIWGSLGYVVYKRTYARELPDGSTEEFWQTLKRVVETTYQIQKDHCNRYRLEWNAYKAQKSAQEMFKLMWAFKFLPPGRGLWAMDMDVINKKGAAVLQNCAFISTADMVTDPTFPFEFLMDMSMLGVGVGFDVKGAGTISITEPKKAFDFKIPDTREGWVESVKLLLLAYFKSAEFPVFDYSEIRDSGEPIKTFGGTASGKEPLISLHNSIHNLFQNRVGEKISTSDIVDIQNLIGKCVVSGNVRRTAEIAFGSADDEEYVGLKQDKEKLESHRWASNNALFAEIGMDYSNPAKSTAINGEPGYAWLDNMRKFSRMNGVVDNKDHRVRGGNPCLEQSLESGESCNLVETFPSHHEDLSDYLHTIKFAYLYAKTVTLIPTHSPFTNSIIIRNRRIGLSQSGIVESFKKFGRRKHMEMSSKAYDYIQDLDTKYSEWFGVAKSIKTTTVKPSGTVSLLAGVTPGIHYAHSEFYIRRVRFDRGSSLLPAIRKAGYKVEDDVYSPSSVVVEFPIKENNYDRSKSEVSMWEQLENAAQIQTYWSDNQVSITVTFNTGETKDVAKALELYEVRLKGVSFLPLDDHGYKQAPYETISEDHYNYLIKDLKPIVFNGVSAGEATEKFCDGETCMI